MTEKEIEMAMQRLFVGAERVRSHKYAARKVSQNVHRQFQARVAAELWGEEKQNHKAA